MATVSFDRLQSNTKYAIACNDESGDPLLSNLHGREIWNALDSLLVTLLMSSPYATEEVLFQWKKEPRHLASAKEPYSWRAALEEIKNADLTLKCESFRGDPDRFILMSDKPTMLKVAGEITNSLHHSYTSRHRISFSQT